MIFVQDYQVDDLGEAMTCGLKNLSKTRLQLKAGKKERWMEQEVSIGSEV